MVNKLIEVGLVIKPHGIKGEVKVKNLSFGNFKFKIGESVNIGENEYKISSVGGSGDELILGLAGVDIAAANMLKNKSIYVPREKIKINDGFLQVDLIGKSLVSGSKIWGKITDISNFGSADVIFVSGDKNFSFANKGGIINAIDSESDSVYVNEKALKEVICYED